jgi:hypothetical protein
MRLIWYQRKDGLWNAACACNAMICGLPFERRADAEAAHFELTIMERTSRTKRGQSQIPPCGPKLPEPNPNDPSALVFP